VNVRSRTVVRPAFENPRSSDPEARLAEEVTSLLRQVHRALREEYFRQAKGTSMARALQYMPVLREVARQPGITINELARVSHLPKSHVSVMMARLVELGIIRKERDERDNRLVRLRLTPRGCRRAESWRAANRRTLVRTLQPLSDDQLALILNGLQLLLSALQRHERNAC
jgi:MarR family transcriptional regulator, organic hydroperoxide resistance regulator